LIKLKTQDTLFEPFCIIIIALIRKKQQLYESGKLLLAIN